MALVVYNNGGSTLTRGTPVYITSATALQVNVAAADATSTATLPAIGILSDDIASNAEGDILITEGLMDFNTSAWSEGDLLYVAVGGGLTNSAPATNSQMVGVVAVSHATDGAIFVNIGQVAGTGSAVDHSTLSNLAWTASGHTGTASTLAAWDGTGAVEQAMATSSTANAVPKADASGHIDIAWIDQSLIDHGSLAGLADDDHPQYLLIDGTRAMTGHLLMGNQDILNALSLQLTEATAGNGTLKLENVVANAHNTGMVTYTPSSGADPQHLSYIIETVDPTKAESVSTGYRVGDKWLNTSRAREFVCVDNTAGNAVWLCTELGMQAHLANNLDINGTATIVLDTVDYTSSGYSYNVANGELTITDKGIYRISCQVGIQRRTGWQNVRMRTYLEYDSGSGFALLPGSERAVTQLSDNKSGNSIGIDMLAGLDAGSKLRIVNTEVGGSGKSRVRQNAALLNVRKVRSGE